MARPTKYQEAYAEQARKLCLLGYTDAELADFFEVSESTINKWKLDYPKFSESIKRVRPSLMQKLVIVFINALWASWLQTSIFVLLKTELSKLRLRSITRLIQLPPSSGSRTDRKINGERSRTSTIHLMTAP